MNENIKTYQNSGLNYSEFLLLKCIFEDIDLFYHLQNINYQNDNFIYPILELENNGFIRMIGPLVHLTEKTKLLFEQRSKKEDGFEEFWELYHNITKKSKSDKEPAKKYWIKLTLKEREKCMNKELLTNYANSVDSQYIKKCRTFLGDKNFNDSYEVKEIIKQSKLV